MTSATRTSGQPDFRVVDRLVVVQDVCLAAVIAIAAVTLGGWLYPPLGALLPAWWAPTNANATFGLLVAAVLLVLPSESRLTARQVLGRVVAASIFVIGALTIVEHMTGRDLGLDLLLVDEPASPIPGRVALQTSLFLTLFGLVTVAGQPRGVLAAAVDALAVLMVGVTMLVLSGYVFGATRFYGQSELLQTSPQTLICMILLSFVIISRRAERGYFRPLVDRGLGGRTVRVVLPIALVTPYLAMLAGAYLATGGVMTAMSAAALTATALCVVILVLVIGAAWWIIKLEQDLREMSLTDSLTGVWNRRGFDVFGEQAMRDARRAHTSLSVLFFDLDNLKQVNDQLGHDAGSEYIKDVARLLRRSFRESDIVGRIGGDEFAIIVHGDRHDPQPELARLDQAIVELNRANAAGYTISYTHGEATRDPLRDESLSELMTRADGMMYERKRAKKRVEEGASTGPNLKPVGGATAIRSAPPAP